MLLNNLILEIKMIIFNEELFMVDYLSDKNFALIYAPLRSLIVKVKLDVAKKIFSNFDFPEKKQYIQYIKNRPLINISEVGEKIIKTSPELSISLTNNCNLNCIYCHANSNHKKKNTTTDTKKINIILDYYFNLLENNFPSSGEAKLSFLGGGEPTLYPKLLLASLKTAKEKSKERNLELIITTATNGCFSKKVADLIMNYFTSISLSFDGPEFIQNFHRPYLNGKNSYKEIFKTAKYFQANNFPFSVRSTLSTITLKNYKKYVDFFDKEFSGIAIGAEPMYKLGRGKNNMYSPSPEEFSNGIANLCEYASNKSITIRNAHLGKFNSIRPFYCTSVAIPNINVSPDGKIWACSRENNSKIFNYGKFNFAKKMVVIDEQKLQKIKNISVFNFTECKNCIGKYHCAGDCPDNRFSGQLKCAGIKSALTIALNNKLKTKEEK